MRFPWLSFLDTPLAGRRALVEWFLVGLTASAIVLSLSVGPAAPRRPNGIIYDALMKLRDSPPNDEVLIAAIDNDSLAALGRWPWPRSVHAAMLDRLTAAGAAGVAYDVLFTEPSSAADDAAFAAALKRSGKVCLSAAVEPMAANGASRALEPLPILRQAAFGLGQVNLTADADGVTRRAPLYLQSGRQIWRHLDLCLMRVAGRTVVPPPSGMAPSEVNGPGLRSQVMMMDYGGPPGRLRAVPFVSILRGEVPNAFLKDKLVLIGMTADGQGDRYATPRSGPGRLAPGVEIQAAIVDTLLRRSAIATVSDWVVAFLSLALLWSLMLGFLLSSPRWILLLGLGLSVLLIAGVIGAFLVGWWFRPLAALAGLLLAFPLWNWRRLAVTSAFMQAELENFRVQDTIADAAADARSGDVVTRQVGAMRAAIAAFRTAQRQRAEALQFLSHDMRAPQVSILTLLGSPHDRADPAFEQRIADNARLTLNLAESYVQLARAESQALQVTLFDAAQALLDAADTLWPLATVHGLKLITPAEPSEALVRGDRPLVTRALMNLIDNAIKFSPPGGEVVCSVELDAEAGVWRIAIRDHGEGMSDEAFVRMQKPFERGEEDGPGVGLGLAFVATVVQRHGGVFTLTSSGGACFEAALPRAFDEIKA